MIKGLDYTKCLAASGWGAEPGMYFLSDGQYGSTGKGLVASALAQMSPGNIDLVTSNAGPNSGHTSYYKGEKIVLMQLPTFSVIAAKMGLNVDTYMNAGAILDIERLTEEVESYSRGRRVLVDPNAAVVTTDAKSEEKGMHESIGSTGKGTGGALARKVMRKEDAVMQSHFTDDMPFDMGRMQPMALASRTSLVEVSQGFSLGINQQFYPYCTSRECTVSQALSDAGAHPNDFRSSMLVFRTFPIRVAGNSGGHYPDQRETSWEKLGQTPEKTTVTQKIRRVFTWSNQQFQEAVIANRSEHIFINFMNYLDREEHPAFLANILHKYAEATGVMPKTVALGHGPRVEDVEMAYCNA